jgi:gentisate 1,2-dioxygenase
MTAPPAPYKIEVEDDSQDKLLGDLPGVDAMPLWKQMSVLVPARPKPKAVPHKWSYVKRFLLDNGEAHIQLQRPAAASHQGGRARSRE